MITDKSKRKLVVFSDPKNLRNGKTALELALPDNPIIEGAKPHSRGNMTEGIVICELGHWREENSLYPIVKDPFLFGCPSCGQLTRFTPFSSQHSHRPQRIPTFVVVGSRAAGKHEIDSDWDIQCLAGYVLSGKNISQQIDKIPIKKLTTFVKYLIGEPLAVIDMWVTAWLNGQEIAINFDRDGSIKEYGFRIDHKWKFCL